MTRSPPPNTRKPPTSRAGKLRGWLLALDDELVSLDCFDCPQGRAREMIAAALRGDVPPKRKPNA